MDLERVAANRHARRLISRLSEMQAQQVRGQARRIGDLFGRGHARKDVFTVAASRRGRAGHMSNEEAGRGDGAAFLKIERRSASYCQS